ncbi:DnaJ-domain-containing protein [Obba rivulosa]|uniref:DnaJ-domain-containing protein n=1 Tax=Obba rivulosa TaxID=1052685 RepID=A0A8E2B670_9APHY|nr:DnaJ-domain-containing protein [Obba rivulosa]
MTVSSRPQDYYEVLGLTHHASKEQIREAYKQLALKWHPDRHTADKDDAQQRFVEIGNAYKKLMSRAQRQAKDSVTLSGAATQRVPQSSVPDSASPPQYRGTKSSTTSAAATKLDLNLDLSYGVKSPRERRQPTSTGRIIRVREDQVQYIRLVRQGGDHNSRDISNGRSRDSERDAYHERTTKGTTTIPASKPDVESVDLRSTQVHPLQPTKSKDSLTKDWIFPLPLSLETLYFGASHHCRITRSLISGKREDVNIDLTIEPGWHAGTRIRCPGAGHERVDGTFQDVVFVVEEVPHPRFRRVDDDLVITVHVPWSDTYTQPRPLGSGYSSAQETAEEAYLFGLGGDEYFLPIPRTLADGATGSHIIGAGMPIWRDGKVVGKGNLKVKWEFIFPEMYNLHQSRWAIFKRAMRWKA